MYITHVLMPNKITADISIGPEPSGKRQNITDVSIAPNTTSRLSK